MRDTVSPAHRGAQGLGFTANPIRTGEQGDLGIFHLTPSGTDSANSFPAGPKTEAAHSQQVIGSPAHQLR